MTFKHDPCHGKNPIRDAFSVLKHGLCQTNIVATESSQTDPYRFSTYQHELGPVPLIGEALSGRQALEASAQKHFNDGLIIVLSTGLEQSKHRVTCPSEQGVQNQFEW